MRGEWVGRRSGWGGFEEVVILALLPPHLSHPPPPGVEDGDFSILWDFVGVGSGQCGSVWEWSGEGCGVDNEWVGRGWKRGGEKEEVRRESDE